MARPLDSAAPRTERPDAAVRPRLSAERLQRLQRTIQSELIPRLLVTHRAGPVPPSLASAVARQLSEVDVSEFIAALRNPDDLSASRYLETTIADGVPVEAVYLDLLAPAARRLGTLWESDECDFVEVTLTMGRMQRMLRDLSTSFLADATLTEPVGSALLGCIPGEQHTLGIIMVGEFLLRGGWRVHVGAPWSDVNLSTMVQREWYDVIGFSVGCENRLSTLAREIRRLRAISRNPNLKIMVGGQVFALDPELCSRVGADAWASDARGAPHIANELLAAARSVSPESRTTARASRSKAHSIDGELREAIRHE